MKAESEVDMSLPITDVIVNNRYESHLKSPPLALSLLLSLLCSVVVLTDLGTLQASKTSL